MQKHTIIEEQDKEIQPYSYTEQIKYQTTFTSWNNLKIYNPFQHVQNKFQLSTCFTYKHSPTLTGSYKDCPVESYDETNNLHIKECMIKEVF